MNIETVLSEFKNYLINKKGRTVSTADAYASDMRKYFSWRERVEGDVSLPLVTADLLENHLGFLREERYAEGSVERKAHGIYSFWKFSYKKSLCHTPIPFEDIEIKFRKTYTLTPRLTESEYNLLVEDINELLRRIK